MKHLPVLLLLIIPAFPLTAQPPGIDQSSELLVVPAGDKFLRWHGHIGRGYFVQVSDTSNPLAKWTWAPIIESGNNEEISYEVDGTADKGFFRLKYTDQLAGPNETLETAYFDGDGLSNIAEISPPPPLTASGATDPLSADTDGDGLRDGFERTHGFDPNDADENDNNLPDGADDRDGDGSSNADEADAGSDPDDPNDTPAGAWHTITGDNPVDEPKTATKTYTIKKGESRLVVVGVTSDEYPEYTGTPSVWDDLLEWEITPSTGDAITGSLYVNDRHDDWVIDEINGVTLNGFGPPPPVHVEQVKIIHAPPNADVTVTVKLTATNISDGTLPSTVIVGLLPVDLDIVHPVTGELTDVKEDVDDGGFVSVQRLEDPSDATSDVTPKTKVKIHAISGAQSTWKTRLKFNGADRYKIYRDEARTQEVVSEQTEFDATQDTALFFHGLKKSVSRGGEQVTMQVKVNNAWVDGDSVKCTIAQSEFLIQVKAFIPYAWSEAEEIPVELNLVNPMAGKVVKGDLHAFTSPRSNGRPASPGFRNRYSTDREPSSVPGDPTHDLFDNAPFRVCQKIILTPYKDLHPSYDLASGRKLWTAPSSDHYVKATSVNAAEISLKKGFMSLGGGECRWKTSHHNRRLSPRCASQ